MAANNIETIKMKMGSVGVAMAVAVMLMLGTVLRGAEAQSVVSCLSTELAPEADANSVVQQLQLSSGQCCQTSNGFCTVVLEIGGAAGTVCGSQGYCPNCADVGNALDQVLAQCVQTGGVEGVYSPDGTSQQLYYLTSSTNPP